MFLEFTPESARVPGRCPTYRPFPVTYSQPMADGGARGRSDATRALRWLGHEIPCVRRTEHTPVHTDGWLLYQLIRLSRGLVCSRFFHSMRASHAKPSTV
eukprot:4847974-Prymnesium_polylepis.1